MYRIKAGDTLNAIAARFHTSVAALQKANGIRNGNLIYPGQQLTVRGSQDDFVPPKPAPRPVRAGNAGAAGPAPKGQVGKWIAEALSILEQHGVPASKMNAADIAVIIQFESGGNPNAINRWDSNARAGHPSMGLMQTIGPTFSANKLPGYDNIRGPIDNIIAGVRYAIARYGSISNVPGIRAVHAGRPYVGY